MLTPPGTNVIKIIPSVYVSLYLAILLWLPTFSARVNVLGALSIFNAIHVGQLDPRVLFHTDNAKTGLLYIKFLLSWF